MVFTRKTVKLAHIRDILSEDLLENMDSPMDNAHPFDSKNITKHIIIHRSAVSGCRSAIHNHYSVVLIVLLASYHSNY